MELPSTRSKRTSRAPSLNKALNISSGGSVVEIGIPKTIYDLNNCTLAPSPSGRALNLTHMFAVPKVNVRRFFHTNTGTFSEHLVALGAPPLLVITLV